MKVLGLDSSGLVAGVALIQDDVLIAEYTTDYKKTHIPRRCFRCWMNCAGWWISI